MLNGTHNERINRELFPSGIGLKRVCPPSPLYINITDGTLSTGKKTILWKKDTLLGWSMTLVAT